MLQIVWVYRVRPPLAEEFQRVYGPAGTWATLFARHGSYRGSRLLKDHNIPHRFMTIDLWEDLHAYEEFKRDHADDFREADGKYNRFFEDQKCIGFFEVDDAGLPISADVSS